MPELPEVETVRRGLAVVLEGARLARVEARRPDLRRPLPPDLAPRTEGRRVVRLGRRAKYLLFHLDDGQTLLAHLGMSGRMRIVADGTADLEPHDHVILTTESGVQIRFNDARRFGVVDLLPAGTLETHPLLAGLGPEPLGNAFNGPSLAASLAGRRTSIKAALLDQRIVAGIGNIYACEALHLAGLSPRRLAATVQGGRAERLATAIRGVLTDAIAAGGSSLRDHVRPDGELGYFQHSFRVYGREGEACPACTACPGIRRLVQAGRSTFYCPVRQR